MENSRIFVADDNASFLDKMAEILEKEGAEMIGALNGAGALTLCMKQQPDAALIHVKLSPLSGADLCKRLKSQVDPTLPVALMFSEETAEAQELADTCGADNFVIRPLKRTELLFCIRSLLRIGRLLKDKQASGKGKSKASRGSMVDLDHFYTFLDLELRRVDRYGFPLSILSVSLDPLPEDAGAWSKSLDDQLGPALAEALRRSVRDIDLSSMLTSRELLVLMPHTDREGAILAANRVCANIASQAYHFGRSRIQPTASVGVACVHGERIRPDDLIKRVTAYCTRASDAGGNKVFAG